MMNTETMDDYLTDMAWGERIDRMISEADDFESFGYVTDGEVFDLEHDDDDYDRTICGHWACDCII